MKQIISGSSFELAIHKDRLKVLERQLIEVQKRNSHYIEQQAMFELVRSDLQKYKQVFDLSKEYETMYSPFTPLHHYTKEQIDKLPKKHSIIDLQKVMSESASPEEIMLL